MNTVKCSNRLCGKEYHERFEKCPFCGRPNYLYMYNRANQRTYEYDQHTYENKSITNEKPNYLARVFISILVAFIVLALYSAIIVAFGWNEYSAVKRIGYGLSLVAGGVFYSYVAKHLNLFPSKKGGRNDEKKKRIILIVSIVAALLLLSIPFITTGLVSKDFKKAKEENTIESYMSFVEKHPNSGYASEARDSIVSRYNRLYEIKEIPEYTEDKILRSKLSELKKERIQNAYNDALSANTIDSWKYYVSIVPKGSKKDALERIRELEEEQLWENEASAWQTALYRNDSASYEKYISYFPKGQHYRQAEKKLIDLEVAKIFSEEHGVLPPMDRVGSTGTSYSIVEIENRTEYDLTVSYSGPDSKRLIIPPHKTMEMRIGNGAYRVAATVGHGVIPFAGTENLEGSRLSSYFYITNYKSNNKFDNDMRVKYPKLFD